MRLKPTELCVLFAIGAAGGLVGEAALLGAGTPRYLGDTMPFVWESQLRFPLLVELATASRGELRLSSRPGPLRISTRGWASPLSQRCSPCTRSPRSSTTSPTGAVEYSGHHARAPDRLLARRRGGVLCGVVAAFVGPLAEVVIVELELARFAEAAYSLFGVALWLPALDLAFGVVAARLADLLVSARPSSATKSGSSSPR